MKGRRAFVRALGTRAEMRPDAIVAVVKSGNKVLLIRRRPSVRNGGYWAPVTGEIQAGEDQEAVVVREVREEVGLMVWLL